RPHLAANSRAERSRQEPPLSPTQPALRAFEVQEVAADELHLPALGQHALELAEAVLGNLRQKAAARLLRLPKAGRPELLDDLRGGVVSETVALDLQGEVVGHHLPPALPLDGVLERLVDAAAGEGPPEQRLAVEAQRVSGARQGLPQLTAPLRQGRLRLGVEEGVLLVARQHLLHLLAEAEAEELGHEAAPARLLAPRRAAH